MIASNDLLFVIWDSIHLKIQLQLKSKQFLVFQNAGLSRDCETPFAPFYHPAMSSTSSSSSQFKDNFSRSLWQPVDTRSSPHSSYLTHQSTGFQSPEASKQTANAMTNPRTNTSFLPMSGPNFAPYSRELLAMGMPSRPSLGHPQFSYHSSDFNSNNLYFSNLPLVSTHEGFLQPDKHQPINSHMVPDFHVNSFLRAKYGYQGKPMGIDPNEKYAQVKPHPGQDFNFGKTQPTYPKDMAKFPEQLYGGFYHLERNSLQDEELRHNNSLLLEQARRSTTLEQAPFKPSYLESSTVSPVSLPEVSIFSDKLDNSEENVSSSFDDGMVATADTNTVDAAPRPEPMKDDKSARHKKSICSEPESEENFKVRSFSGNEKDDFPQSAVGNQDLEKKSFKSFKREEMHPTKPTSTSNFKDPELSSSSSSNGRKTSRAQLMKDNPDGETDVKKESTDSNVIDSVRAVLSSSKSVDDKQKTLSAVIQQLQTLKDSLVGTNHLGPMEDMDKEEVEESIDVEDKPAEEERSSKQKVGGLMHLWMFASSSVRFSLWNPVCAPLMLQSLSFPLLEK